MLPSALLACSAHCTTFALADVCHSGTPFGAERWPHTQATDTLASERRLAPSMQCSAMLNTCNGACATASVGHRLHTKATATLRSPCPRRRQPEAPVKPARSAPVPTYLVCKCSSWLLILKRSCSVVIVLSPQPVPQTSAIASTSVFNEGAWSLSRPARKSYRLQPSSHARLLALNDCVGDCAFAQLCFDGAST